MLRCDWQVGYRATVDCTACLKEANLLSRNGGHINPPLFHDYEDLKRSLGKAAAQQIMRFRNAHLGVLLEVAKAEADNADCRPVDSVDVFFDETVFTEAKRKLSVFEAEMPEEANTFRIWEGEDARRVRELPNL